MDEELSVTPVDRKAVIQGLPRPRIQPFLDAADDDPELALSLYSWNAQMAGAAFEQISHLEVLLRHAIDTELSAAAHESSVGIPWFMLPPYMSVQAEAVETVRARLRPLRHETRDQIVAGLSFGYWTGWLGKNYEQLWRDCLHRAFPHGSGRRKDAARLAEQVRKFRNRIAHHDSLLRVDVGFEMQSIFALASQINPEAAKWMQATDRTHEVGQDKPVVQHDVVVVPAISAWPLYQSSHAYVCQAGRYFQQVEYVAFYTEKAVQPEVAKIKGRVDNVPWGAHEARSLCADADRDHRRLGKIMQSAYDAGWTHGTYQVFFLTEPGEPGHVTLPARIVNDRAGKSSAFVRKQRYTSIHQLRHAATVWDL